MANRRVPKFSLNNCDQSSKKTFMCPEFCTNPVLKYTKCQIFQSYIYYIAKNYLPLLQQIAGLLKKIGCLVLLITCRESSATTRGVYLQRLAKLLGSGDAVENHEQSESDEEGKISILNNLHFQYW